MKTVGPTLVWVIQMLVRRWFLLFALVALYYYHVILDKDMLCPCSSQSLDCWVYLLVPGLVLFLVQLLVDLSFHRVCRLLCGNLCRKMVLVLLKRVLEAGFVGLLWVESVMLDGDWYICCGRGNLCILTPPDQPRPPLAQIKNESQVIGMLLVVVVTLTAAIFSWIPFGKCSESCSCDWTEAVLVEAELVVYQRMRTDARSKLDQSGDNWRNCEELERELLLGPKASKTQNLNQNTVHMNPLPFRPTSRLGPDQDWSRGRPGLKHV